MSSLIVSTAIEHHRNKTNIEKLHTHHRKSYYGNGTFFVLVTWYCQRCKKAEKVKGVCDAICEIKAEHSRLAMMKRGFSKV